MCNINFKLGRTEIDFLRQLSKKSNPDSGHVGCENRIEIVSLSYFFRRNTVIHIFCITNMNV
jgi:hypothetical protein